jgi:predicted enzyme related to lactoylglutathione lyase
MMQRPVHFELYASNPQRAIEFYHEIFGWEFQEYMPNFYWLIKTGEMGTPGIDGGMGVREGPAPEAGAPNNGFVCTIDVPDVDATIAAVQKAGCEVAMPKHAVPSVGWHFYFIDPEGNLVGAMQRDPGAA